MYYESNSNFIFNYSSPAELGRPSGGDRAGACRRDETEGHGPVQGSPFRSTEVREGGGAGRLIRIATIE